MNAAFNEAAVRRDTSGRFATKGHDEAADGVDALGTGDSLTFDEVVDAAGITDPRMTADDIANLCGIDPSTARFEPTTVQLSDLEGWGSAPEDYLLEGDEEGYETVVSLTDAFVAGDDVPPILVGADRHIPGGIQVIDGFHRVGGARTAGLTEIPAFKVVAGEPPAPPTADRDQSTALPTTEERLALFRAQTGRRATVDARTLDFLGIVGADQGRIGGGSFHYFGDTADINDQTPVVVRQGKVKVARVMEYVEMMRRGEPIEPISVTDRPDDGKLWHLDGAHRLVASRLAGVPITAHVWR